MSKYSFLNGSSIDHQNITIPKIRFIEILGEGANAVVLKSHDNLLDRDVAVKIWLPREGFRYPDKSRFLAEIRKISPLSRPQIVQIYDANVINGKYCFAILELIDGITLKKWLSEDRDLPSRLDIAKKLFQEIVVLHKLGIFHGDLHDRNILIKNSGEIKLLDFGTSIFCRSDNPHDREKKVLIETGIKILFEEEKYQFLDIDLLLEAPSECVPYVLYTLTRILEFFHMYKLKTGGFSSDNDGKKKLVFTCFTWVSYIPFFCLPKFDEVFKECDIGIEYRTYFLSLVFHWCREEEIFRKDKSIQLEPMEINAENLEKFNKLYSSRRAEFIQNALDGTVKI